MTGAGRGSITGGTWLIGLGVVFLIREAANVPVDNDVQRGVGLVRILGE